MNGVHCQMREAATASIGMSEIQSGWAGVSSPKSPATQVHIPLRSPYSGLYRACFQSSAAETGTSRNGVMSRVRTNPRPKNVRSSRRANSRPRTRLARTTEAVSRTVVRTDPRRAGSVATVT